VQAQVRQHAVRAALLVQMAHAVLVVRQQAQAQAQAPVQQHQVLQPLLSTQQTHLQAADPYEWLPVQ
jgi:hypothetical protein